MKQFTLASLSNSPLVLPVVLLLAALLFFSQGFLHQSFWLDECISAWVVGDGARQVFERSTAFQGQSPLYYFILWAFLQVVSTDTAPELMYRLPSLVFLVISVGVLFSVAKDLGGREVALFSAIFFMAHPAVLRALSARPYALALLASLVATRAAISWCREGRRKDLLMYSVAMLFAFYAHFLFVLIVPIHLLLPVLLKNRVALVGLMLSGLVVAFGALAGTGQLLSLIERKEALAFIPFPTVGRVVETVLPLSILVPFAGGLLIAKLLRPREFSFERPAWLRSWYFVVWWLVGPAVFLVIATSSTTSLFHDRYFLWSVAGLALLLATAIASVSPERARVRAALFAFVLLLVAEGERRWQIEDWRGASALAKATPEMPLVLSSGLIESANPAWLASAEYAEYLRSPLSVYGVAAAPILMPQALDTEEQRQFFISSVVTPLKMSPSYLIVFLSPLHATAKEALAQFNKEQGFRSEVLMSGLVTVVRFSKG